MFRLRENLSHPLGTRIDGRRDGGGGGGGKCGKCITHTERNGQIVEIIWTYIQVIPHSGGCAPFSVASFVVTLF